MQVETTILGVTQKEITKKDGGKMVLFEVDTSDGTTWTTGKNELALDANNRVGQQAIIDGTIKENGKFKNYYLNSITDSPNSVTAPSVNSPSPTTTPVFPTTASAGNSTITWNIPSAGAWTAKDQSIWRQTATKVAAHISDGDPQTFWQNVDELVKYYETGEKPAFVTANSTDDIPF